MPLGYSLIVEGPSGYRWILQLFRSSTGPETRASFHSASSNLSQCLAPIGRASTSMMSVAIDSVSVSLAQATFIPVCTPLWSFPLEMGHLVRRSSCQCLGHGK